MTVNLVDAMKGEEIAVADEDEDVALVLNHVDDLDRIVGFQGRDFTSRY